MSSYHGFYCLLIVSRRLYWRDIMFSFSILKALRDDLKGWSDWSDISILVHWKFFRFSCLHCTETLRSSLTRIFYSLSPSCFSLSLISFSPSLSLILSVFLCAPLLKTVSALLLLHQKAVAKWRLTSAAATEEGLCVFSSWGQIPLKRAKLRSTISHCNENPNFNQQDRHFQ